jgi:hypothetical protein
MIFVEEKDKRFYLSNSTLPNAGLGVFASEDISKGEVLEIIGIMVEKNSITDQCTSYANNYKFSARYDNPNRNIVPMGFGGMVNHTDDTEKQNVELTYMKRTPENTSSGSAVYYFLKDVKKGEEILGNYGEKWSAKLAEKNDWQMFLDLELYNLKELKR